MKRLPCAAILSALLLSACSTPYHPAVIPEPRTNFPGLVKLLADQQGQPLDVLLVHGMCTHDARWAAATATLLAAAIKRNLPPAPATLGAGTDADVQIIPSTLDTPAGQLRLEALIWSPLTAAPKRQLCEDQTSKSALCAGSVPYPYQRASLNARIKDVLLDDCLADVVIYIGQGRETIQRRMRDAILRSGALNGTAPLVIITESLGSAILFDTLRNMSEEPPGTRAAGIAQQTVQRMRYLVMAANQIPLLELGAQPLAASPTRRAGPANSLEWLLQRWRPMLAAPPQPLDLLAFSDPNDVLSYLLQASRYRGMGVSVNNVLVSNAPTLLHTLERPDLAHTGYLSNPDVGRLIVCGEPTDDRCK